jgi:hypothetical protein
MPDNMILKKSIIVPSIALVCMLFSSQSHAQVHFSLAFGKDFLKNNVKIGLERGLSFSNITGAGDAKSVRSLNLGLFVDLKIKDSTWFLHSGALLKSGMGAQNISSYPLNSTILDSVFASGSIERQLKYIHIPVLLRYKFNNHLFVEMGPRFGILTKATDHFYEPGKPENGSYYKNNLTGRCNWFDAGIEAGMGYHLLRGKGVNLGLRYYYGMTDLFRETQPDPVRQQALTIYLNIPILIGKHPEKPNDVNPSITKK